MAATAKVTPKAKAVTRRFERPDGACAALAYAEQRDGTHVVRWYGPDGEAERWRCQTVEAARTRWGLVQKKAVALGFEAVRVPEAY